ncbi:MAG: HK97 gp10 family phage protein, partial [Ruminiclostridium sp.]|nr:HK97 gp10 family phage protein [Ruminiclostridium sp.]
EGLDGLISKLSKLDVDVPKILDEALFQGAIKIRDSAKQNIRIKGIYDIGDLYEKTTVEKIPKGYSIGTNLEHGPYNEFGTGLKGDPSVPHTQRRFWRYQDEDGKWHTSHGMKARPFLRPALNDNKKYVVLLARSKLLLVLQERIK